MEQIQFSNIEERKRPVITLNGDQVITLTTEQSYIEKGANAFNFEGGEITSKIKIVGDVDVSKPGTYTITYNVSEDIPAFEVTRTIIVKGKFQGDLKIEKNNIFWVHEKISGRMISNMIMNNLERYIEFENKEKKSEKINCSTRFISFISTDEEEVLFIEGIAKELNIKRKFIGYWERKKELLTIKFVDQFVLPHNKL